MKKRFKLVTLEQSPHTGHWIWIEDLEGTLWTEVGCGLDLRGIPQLLHEDIQSAYDWAVAENKRIDQEEGEKAKQESRDYRKEREDYYNSTRGTF